MALKITDLLGSYDNFNEEPGYLNNPQNILAVTITFMVSCIRIPDRVLSGRTAYFLHLCLSTSSPNSFPDILLDICLDEAIHAFLHCARSRVGRFVCSTLTRKKHFYLLH